MDCATQQSMRIVPTTVTAVNRTRIQNQDHVRRMVFISQETDALKVDYYRPSDQEANIFEGR